MYNNNDVMIFDSDIIMPHHIVVCDIYALWFMDVNNVDTAAKCIWSAENT